VLYCWLTLKPTTTIKTLTQEQRDLLASALTLLPDVSAEDLHEVFSECTGGHDDRVLLVDSLHNALASACVYQGEHLQGEYELYIKDAGSYEDGNSELAEEHYEFALFCCAGAISVESYTHHHTVITEEEAHKVAQEVLDKQFPNGIKTRQDYDRAELALSDAIDALE